MGCMAMRAWRVAEGFTGFKGSNLWTMDFKKYERLKSRHYFGDRGF